MTITLTVVGRIATVEADGHVVAGNTYPVALSLDSEWTGSLYLRVRFGSLYYDIPFASSDTSVDVQMPVGYPEVGIGVFSEALQICTNEARIRLLRSILEAGEQVVEFDSDLYDQWAGEVSELLCDDAFDSTSDRPVKNSVITAWKDTVPIDSDLVHKTGQETIGGNKIFTGQHVISGENTSIVRLRSALSSDANSWKAQVNIQDSINGSPGTMANIAWGTYPPGGYEFMECSVKKPDRSAGYAFNIRAFSDHLSLVAEPFYPVDGSGNPQALGTSELMRSGNIAVDPRIVHTSGVETIAGDKTFTGNVTVQKSDEVALIVRDTRNYGTTQVKGGVQIYCKNSNGNDANMGSVSLFQSVSAGIQRSQMQLTARNTAGQSAVLLVSQYEDGHADTESPTYAPVDGSGNHLTPSAKSIINSSMLAVDPRVVHTTGNETIAGTKTFSAPIEGMLTQTSVANSTVQENQWVKCFSIPAQNGVNLHFSVRTSYNSPDFSYAKFSIGAGGSTASAISAHCTLSTGYTQAMASMSNYKVTLETVDGTAYIVFYMKKSIRYSSVFIEEKRFFMWSSPTQVTFYYNEASANEPVESDTVSIIPIVGYYLGGVQA